MKTCLNVGCGRKYIKSNGKCKWVNLDNNKRMKTDIFADLEKPLDMIKDNTFDFVIIDNVLEHISNYIALMSELKRICKNGAIIDIRVPHATCMNTYRDPTHRRFYAYNSFEYFEESYSYDFPKFKILDVKLIYSVYHKGLNVFFGFLINLYPSKYERLFGWIFPCEEVRCKMEVTK